MVSKNREISDKPKKQRSLGIRLVKYFLIGIGSILLLLFVFVMWIYFSIFSGPDPLEFSDYHPFRSEETKTEYLEFEGKIAKSWPINS